MRKRKRLKEFLDDELELDSSLDDTALATENDISKKDLTQFYLPNVKEITIQNNLESFAFSIKPKRIRKSGSTIRVINRLGDTLEINLIRISAFGYLNEFGEVVFLSKDKRNQIIFKGTF